MRRFRLFLTMAVALTLFLWPALESGAQDSSYKVQFSYTFTNQEAEPVVGLHIELSNPAEIMLDEKGHAGPFKNVQGNGNKKIILTNPDAVIPVSGEGNKLELMFRTERKKLAISKWWWLDEKGKRIGEKKKG